MPASQRALRNLTSGFVLEALLLRMYLLTVSLAGIGDRLSLLYGFAYATPRSSCNWANLPQTSTLHLHAMNHEAYMLRCLELAKLGTGNVAPNPLVGCVIVHDERIIGEGYHQKCGEAHAEVNAINSVKDKNLLKEATVFVSLEPCAHQGKTPPCANLLVKCGVQKVVVATLDPHEKVAGKGVKILEHAGIEVEVGCMEAEAKFVARRFFTYHQKNRPHVVLKWAETADGFLDKERLTQGQPPLKISSENSDVYSHHLRAAEHAIMVGTETALLDNPSLTIRNAVGSNPLRVVLDRNLRLPDHLNLFIDGNRTILFNQKKSALNGATEFAQIADWNLKTILNQLHAMNVQSVMVEGGAALLSSFVQDGLWDEAHRIKSANVFAYNGPKAPLIRGVQTDEFRTGSDMISVYQNPQNG